MVEYALILFLFSNNGYITQTTSVNLGFKTEKFCEEAGEKAFKEANTLENESYKAKANQRSVKFICVRTK
jgi:hypothetical protein